MGGRGRRKEGKGRKGRGEDGGEWEGDSFGPRSGPPTFFADLHPAPGFVAPAENVLVAIFKKSLSIIRPWTFHSVCAHTSVMCKYILLTYLLTENDNCIRVCQTECMVSTIKLL